MKKTCTKCKIEKPLDEFNNRKDGLFGKRADCKDCRRQLENEYRSGAGREMRNKSHKRWREKDPERYKQINNTINKRQRDNLTDAYVTRAIKSVKDLANVEVTPDIIESYRAILKLKRVVKAHDKQQQ